MTLTVKWGGENYSLRGTEQTLSDLCCLSFAPCNAETKKGCFFERVLTLNSGRQECACQVNIPPLGVGRTPCHGIICERWRSFITDIYGVMLRDLPLTERYITTLEKSHPLMLSLLFCLQNSNN